MASTLTAGDLGGAAQGYYSAFGVGSLSPDTFGGFTCTIIITGYTPGSISATFSGGDATAFLSGKAISVNGTAYSTITSGPTYDSGSDTTFIEWVYGPGNFNTTPGSNSYTIDIGAGGGPTYAGPTYVGKSTAAGGTGSVSPDFTSSGRASGDLLILAVETANQALTAPGGWTEVATYSPQSRGTAGAAGGVRLTLFYKTSDGTETTVATGDSGDHQYAVGFVFRGASGASVAVDTGAGNNVAATTSGSFGGVTTTGDDRLIAHFVATDRDSTAASWGTATNANLANLTEQHDAGTTSGAGGGIALITGEKQASGATGSTTSTQAASAAYCWITLALQNSAGGVTGTASGSISLTGSATGTVSVSGTASGTFALTGSATAAIAIAGAASGTLDLTGSATGSTLVTTEGTASGTIDLSGSATGAVAVAGTATGSIGLSGSSSCAVALSGAVTGSIAITGAATGAVAVSGAATGAIDLSGSTSGAIAIAGSASGSIGLDGNASAIVAVAGVSSGSIGLAGAASGSNPVSGVASGSIDLTGSATGVSAIATTGTASGDIDLSGSASATVIITGVASSTLTLGGVSTGSVSLPSITGSASGSLGLSGSATGDKVRRITGADRSGSLTVASDVQDNSTTITGPSRDGSITVTGSGSSALTITGPSRSNSIQVAA